MKSNKKMNRVTISIPEEIDLNFRQKAAIKFAFRRGWYGKAILEAIELWITMHTKKFQDIPDESKNILWHEISDEIKVNSDDPYKVTESILNYFNNLKYADNIRYEMNDDKILIKKTNSLESYVPYLITNENGSILLNCPVKAVTDAALKELTGSKYNIISNENSLLYTYETSKFQDKKLPHEKMSTVNSSQLL